MVKPQDVVVDDAVVEVERPDAEDRRRDEAAGGPRDVPTAGRPPEEDEPDAHDEEHQEREQSVGDEVESKPGPRGRIDQSGDEVVLLEDEVKEQDVEQPAQSEPHDSAGDDERSVEPRGERHGRMHSPSSQVSEAGQCKPASAGRSRPSRHARTKTFERARLGRSFFRCAHACRGVTDDVRVSGVDHVELTVPDRREAAEWYERVLGLVVLDEYESWADDPGGPLMVSSDEGATKLALFAGEPTTGLDEYRVAFRVDAAGFRAFLDRLDEEPLSDATGERVTAGDVVDHDRSASIYFTDPYGHALELTTYEYDALGDLFERDG